MRESGAWFHCLAKVSSRSPKWLSGQVSENIPNLQNPLAISPSPDAENILAIPNTENNAANIVVGVAKLITNQSQQNVLPVAIGNTLPQAHNPLSSVLVLFVLPYWPNSFLEQVIVGHQRQTRGALEVLVNSEELLSRLARGDRVQSLLVLDEAVSLRDGGPIPEDPAVTQLVI